MDSPQLPTAPATNAASTASRGDVGQQHASISDHERILYRIKQLAPWRMSVQITDSINTGDYLARRGTDQTTDQTTDVRDGRSDTRKQFHRLLKTLYPNGLKTKRLFDCGCGAGGYCFWARDLKAEISMGIDVREHWIKQARFLRFNRTVGISNRLKFQVLNLYDLPKEHLFPFDIVLFKDIFFHLPDPLNGLRIAADLSRDIVVFSSSIIWGEPDGSLKSERCEKPALHGGTGGLNWYPTGPGVCADIIRDLGFEDLVLTKHKQVAARPDRGRIEIIASREPNRIPSSLGKKL